jgi:hypothetical protein
MYAGSSGSDSQESIYYVNDEETNKLAYTHATLPFNYTS